MYFGLSTNQQPINRTSKVNIAQVTVVSGALPCRTYVLFMLLFAASFHLTDHIHTDCNIDNYLEASRQRNVFDKITSPIKIYSN